MSKCGGGCEGCKDCEPCKDPWECEQCGGRKKQLLTSLYCPNCDEKTDPGRTKKVDRGGYGLLDSGIVDDLWFDPKCD
jgi:hypothetical protein